MIEALNQDFFAQHAKLNWALAARARAEGNTELANELAEIAREAEQKAAHAH